MNHHHMFLRTPDCEWTKALIDDLLPYLVLSLSPRSCRNHVHGHDLMSSRDYHTCVLRWILDYLAFRLGLLLREAIASKCRKLRGESDIAVIGYLGFCLSRESYVSKSDTIRRNVQSTSK
mmetsp:Transcript_29358/g.43338  ORF Transcript_29358/g.43338 Transcript_29358/m.43338 type:complete len:120 (+) Transcript_29358:1927-2286(+)